MQAEFEAAFHLTFRVVELLGREECGEATADEHELMRLLTPIAKLMTGKQAVAVASEALEAFGGAGYVEDTGLPLLLRDAQVLPIWEGTTNVLSLDTLRALAHGDGLSALDRELTRLASTVRDPAMVEATKAARSAFDAARAWVSRAFAEDRGGMEAGARRFAMTLGRSVSLALLAHHAEWALSQGDPRPRAAAVRFQRHGVEVLAAMDATEAALLARDE